MSDHKTEKNVSPDFFLGPRLRLPVRQAGRISKRNRGGRPSERGIALATALVAAVVVSILAVVAINLTFRRFELSAFRTDHGISGHASEAGIRYAFERLRIDPAFEAAVRADDTPDGGGPRNGPVYVLSPLAEETEIEFLFDGRTRELDVDEQVQALELGRKLIHIGIQIDPNDATRLRIHTNADYGTGE